MKIYNQLDKLERYLHNLEDYLEKEADQAKSKEERQELEEHFPDLLCSSAFVTIYSTIEAELNRICLEQQKDRGLSLELGELKGNGIIRAHTYLGRVCGLKVPGGKSWKELKHYNSLRNVIVHKDGEENNRQLARYIKEHPLLAQQGLHIVLDKAFCAEVVASARSFFHELEEALIDKEPAQRPAH